MSRITLNIDDALHEALLLHAAKHTIKTKTKITVSDVIRHACVSLLNAEEKLESLK